MENELLAFEVRFLRSRLGWTGRSAVASASLSRLAHLEEAERDLALRRVRPARRPRGAPARLDGEERGRLRLCKPAGPPGGGREGPGVADRASRQEPPGAGPAG